MTESLAQDYMELLNKKKMSNEEFLNNLNRKELDWVEQQSKEIAKAIRKAPWLTSYILGEAKKSYKEPLFSIIHNKVQELI